MLYLGFRQVFAQDYLREGLFAPAFILATSVEGFVGHDRAFFTGGAEGDFFKGGFGISILFFPFPLNLFRDFLIYRHLHDFFRSILHELMDKKNGVFNEGFF